MKVIVGIMLYLLIGIISRRAFGYKGLVETVLWPIGIPCAIYLKMNKEDGK